MQVKESVQMKEVAKTVLVALVSVVIVSVASMLYFEGDAAGPTGYVVSEGGAGWWNTLLGGRAIRKTTTSAAVPKLQEVKDASAVIGCSLVGVQGTAINGDRSCKGVCTPEQMVAKSKVCDTPTRLAAVGKKDLYFCCNKQTITTFTVPAPPTFVAEEKNLPVGRACLKNTWCATGLCKDWVCTAPPPPPTTGTTGPATDRPGGFLCTAASQCLSKNCVNGRCVACGTSVECQYGCSSGQCTARPFCENGVCRGTQDQRTTIQCNSEQDCTPSIAGSQINSVNNIFDINDYVLRVVTDHTLASCKLWSTNTQARYNSPTNALVLSVTQDHNVYYASERDYTGTTVNNIIKERKPKYFYYFGGSPAGTRGLCTRSCSSPGKLALNRAEFTDRFVRAGARDYVEPIRINVQCTTLVGQEAQTAVVVDRNGNPIF